MVVVSGRLHPLVFELERMESCALPVLANQELRAICSNQEVEVDELHYACVIPEHDHAPFRAEEALSSMSEKPTTAFFP